MLLMLLWLFLVVLVDVEVFSALYSSIDKVVKEKLAPFSTLSNDESYQSRDLEKVLYI